MNTLVKGLIDIAIRIAKFIVRRVARWTIDRVIVWMRERVAVFQHRLARADTDRRKRWLIGRIMRWEKAARWLQQNAMKALAGAAEKVCKLPAFSKLPEIAKCERLVAA